MSTSVAEGWLTWEWQYPLYAAWHGGEFSDDWYEAMAMLMAERSPA